MEIWTDILGAAISLNAGFCLQKSPSAFGGTQNLSKRKLRDVALYLIDTFV